MNFVTSIFMVSSVHSFPHIISCLSNAREKTVIESSIREMKPKYPNLECIFTDDINVHNLHSAENKLFFYLNTIRFDDFQESKHTDDGIALINQPKKKGLCVISDNPWFITSAMYQDIPCIALVDESIPRYEYSRADKIVDPGDPDEMVKKSIQCFIYDYC